MYEVLYVVLGIIVTLVVLGVMRLVAQNSELRYRVAASIQLEDVRRELKKMSEAMDFVARGHQLSTIFGLGENSLRVMPEDFEPNKEAVRKALFKKATECKNEDPDTWAFVVLNHSGWDSFVDSETRANVKKALARLRANGDPEAIQDFLNDIVDQLSPEPAVA